MPSSSVSSLIPFSLLQVLNGPCRRGRQFQHYGWQAARSPVQTLSTDSTTMCMSLGTDLISDMGGNCPTSMTELLPGILSRCLD
ncbi:hypothetical protein N657DRAFT_235100 [Parathielavia appendiculata]|uniref:Uncharacterized protein n=1 Tax=Parathielavia appendiculata TaxID=2587402 RepID=A0AAN6U7L3_9PEZI|nr:hypothetical protein N657DRAFT_235100 [Parathielavia appendiculata]